jgi:hypothetical protein
MKSPALSCTTSKLSLLPQRIKSPYNSASMVLLFLDIISIFGEAKCCNVKFVCVTRFMPASLAAAYGLLR